MDQLNVQKNSPPVPGMQKNAGTNTIEFIFDKTNQNTEGQPMLEKSIPSDHRKQRLVEKYSLQE